jgi:outer membrane receptor protein involved in Fe transport
MLQPMFARRASLPVIPLLTALLTFVSFNASAQDTGPDAEEAAGQRVRAAADVEEVTVTARKKEESLKDVPISITALTAESLKEKRILDAYDVADFTPNFTFSQNLGRRLDVPNIRGQFGPFIGGTAPNASFFVDGVYVAGSAGTGATANLERVEVLRGPQSALFGRATFSGAINYITRRPTDEFEGEASADIGEEGREDYSAWASGPVIEDKVYYFVAGNYNAWDGEWRNNLQPGQVNTGPNGLASIFGPGIWAFNQQEPGDPPCPPGSQGDPVGCAPTVGDNTRLGGEETTTGTFKLLFTPTDNLDITTKYERIDAEDDHFAYLFVPPTDPLSGNNCFNREATTGNAIDPRAGTRSGGWLCGSLTETSAYKPVINLPNFKRGVTVRAPGSPPLFAAPAPFIGLDETLDRYLVDVNYDFRDYTFIARYSREDRTSKYARDLDRSYALGPVATGLFEAIERDETEFDSFEYILQSPVDKPVIWSLGYYYYDQQDDSFTRNFTGFGRNLETDNGSQSINNKAWFGSVEWQISEKWNVAFEGRYAEDEISRTSEFLEANPFVDSPEETFYSFSPRYTLRYFVNEDVSTYFTVAEGNKPGGFNFAYFDSDADPTQANSSKAIIEEEEATTWEVGLKGSFFENRLEANVAAFYIDWENQAINVTECIPTNRDPDQGGNPGFPPCEVNNIVQNAGESRVYGAEVEMSFFATEYLTLSLGYGWTDTELEEFFDAELATLLCDNSCYEAAPGTSPGDEIPSEQAVMRQQEFADVSGNQAPRVPEHNLVLSSMYMRPLTSATEWYWRNDWRYESKRYSTASNLTYAPSFWNWNMRVGLEADRWSASVYVENLTDEKSPIQIQDFPLFDAAEGYIPARDPDITTIARNPVNQNAFQILPRQSRWFGAAVSYRFGAR